MAGPLDVALGLAGEGAVQAYFLLLTGAMYYCYRRSKEWWPIFSATAIVGVTWYYICLFTVEYEQSGQDGLFDAAYSDVVQPPHYRLSSQLLTWVVVAVVWAHEAAVAYLLFGVLGAMSAAFVTWVPLQQPSGRKVPIAYFACSFVSLLAIHQLQAMLDSPAAFGLWLKVLHVSLVLPKIAYMVMPTQRRVDATPLYAALGIAIVAWHFYLGTLQAYAWPQTACQLSINCDMVLCSLITVYAVGKRFGLPGAALAAAAIPIISPGAVLAFYLARVHLPASHAEAVTRFQVWASQRKRISTPLRRPRSAATECPSTGGPEMNRRLASLTPTVASMAAAQGTTHSDQQPQSTWMNLGLWTDGSGYDEACQRLAMRLGSSILAPGDAVLACGCGYGDELHYFKDTFGVRHITGIDVNADAAVQFSPQHNVRLLHLSTDAISSKFPQEFFNKIISLDNVYHYADKEVFFRSAAAHLPFLGKIGVTDIVLRPSAPFWLRGVLSAMSIPSVNLWGRDFYEEKLRACDLTVETFETLPGVLEQWFPAFVSRHLDYCVVVAVKAVPAGQTHSPKPKPKLAIVGSGISGLTAANILSATHDITIFEAQPKAGLNGSAATMHGLTMDIPLRMIGDGYYTYVMELAQSLNVPLVDARADCCWWGESAPAGVVGYSSRTVDNLRTAARVLLHLPACIRFGHEVRNSPVDDESAQNESWGQWLDRHGYNRTNNGSCSNTLFMWAIMGQLSWLLSCSYEQVRGYPSHIILGFFQKLGISFGSMFEANSDIKRVSPSVEKLQYAMSYGCELLCDTRVGDVGADRTVNGQRFDKIIIATEASAVPKILRSTELGSLFSRVLYQPSHIVLHRDASLMPANRADWKALNVCQRDESDMCMLTVWMNEYYPNSTLPHDIFQTWNPFNRPAEVLKEAHFLRVVHTQDTPELLRQIQELQGKDGIYFVGSYCADGMGLLEQAASSAKTVAERILQHLDQV